MFTTYATAPLIRATVHGSRFLHLVPDGHALALCGSIGDYPHRWQPQRPLCDSCASIARRTGRAMPC